MARGYLTEKPIDIGDYLPSRRCRACRYRQTSLVDVVIPVYRGWRKPGAVSNPCWRIQARRLARMIVVDDRSPEPELVAWLQELRQGGKIHLIRNPSNVGFVASVNNGMKAAGDHDVVLLNSDTEVPAGWLGRLDRAGLCADPHRDGIAVFQQRHDLRLSRQARRPDRVRANRWRISTKPAGT